MRKEMSQVEINPPHDSRSVSTFQPSPNTQLTGRTTFTQTLPTDHSPSTQPDNRFAGKNYGSPFANSPDWSPTSQDVVLVSIPEQTLQARLKARFARTPGDIFNPPSASFSRPAPHTIKSDLFEPYFISGKGALMGDGFKPHYPGRILALRDVSAADWGRFLEDIEVAGRLTGPQCIVSNVAPLRCTWELPAISSPRSLRRG
ncbi:hypothetical protein BCR39DRAFT_114570 [Naematelia encephala]|uniref:Uncharacterized protein n=1 Tax=Naematelia encephala TaxID=71784 RepID=A0A1Y2BIC8_9TREE|nr:hypothetical protein BCR39DRAFT_114570 [Naematelia encephala]